MTGFTFIMLFDDAVTPMFEAVMHHGMASRFPACRFETDRAPNESLENAVIPLVGTVRDDGRGVLRYPPAGLRSEIEDVFDDLLQEARAARPS